MSATSTDQITVGVQMWSLRTLCEDGPAPALKAIADAGFKWVEPYSFFEGTINDWRALLAEYDLKVVSSHVPLEKLENELNQVMDDHARIHCRTIVCPWVDEERRQEADAFDRLGESLDAIGSRLRSWGYELLYHNHDFEFLLEKSPDGVQRILKNSDPVNVGLQLDTYWAYATGNNPVPFIKSNGERLRSIHLKDGDPRRDKFTPLGEGRLKMQEIIQEALHQGITHFVYEQDEHEGDPAESLKQSWNFLQGLGLIQG